MQTLEEYLSKLSPEERRELDEQRKHAVSCCTLEGVCLPHPDETENLFELVSKRERFIVDTNSNWKAESAKPENCDKAFIIGKTITDEQDDLRGLLFGEKVKTENNNLFLLGIEDYHDKPVIQLERLDAYFRLILDEKSLERESRPRAARTEADFLQRVQDMKESIEVEKEIALRLLGVHAISELPYPVNPELRSHLANAIKQQSPLCGGNYGLAVSVARHCFALLLAEKQKARTEFADPDYLNVLGDTRIIQNALFLQARILTGDKLLRRMAKYAGLEVQ